MLRWIRSSSRVEIFIFLIDWWIFFGIWDLDIQRRDSFSSQSLLKVNNSFWNTFLEWMNSMILGGHQGDHHHFCILYFFFSWFLKVIFRSMFFPSNRLVKESNLIDVFREGTCRTSWFETESSIILWALTKFFLWKASSLISLWNWNLYAHVGVQSIFFREIIYF